ncbi:NAD(P)-dependent oxidoreductase [Paraburkholderia caballeronis]|uniref:Gluconate 2-dehydrogenase n=1 Tax=Paraburkholderia caballeronis TaxID=416943 RepID=A0A1H7J1A6_9BURK|nr:NAD(P)-dependent oxidoreductase [Paraburkholderia caballeronis]PXW27628.1 gluconate 2-dehydrogenase [Paraburkholderia caballeronis]PXX03102.1 gluconate 2-dehydrogenase [Paraburkholderia caballeronis]RAK03827.1 gluconate 2-dehydrogenase [Paraburkholderia caballeronis]TDV37907.1 gluconate 2-dehydrogenase [Paraburkholderia caballeronis]SEC17007.1 gluconate 2-dehydrogenase [Paraburkholderia caballeronis]
MKPTIVAYKTLPADVSAYLREHADVVEVDADQPGALAAALRDADGAIGASVKIAPAMLDGSRVKALSTISVGYDNFDVADLTRRGIVLAHTPDVLTESTADTVFSLILASARRVVELAEWVKAGHWKASIGPAQFGVDVQGKTLGIVGLGRIGGAVARRAALGFNMRVLYTNRSPNADAERLYGARRVELDELLATSDFVCLQVPLTDATRHLIGAAELRKMKRDAILINASRGATVDEPALIDALRDGTIRGAGLDVFETEPLPADSPLLAMPNVVALPHIGSATHETRHAMARCAAENLIAALDGTLTRNVVNREVLAR